MLKGATARRYAEAVFEIGVEQHTVDRWREDVGTVAEYFGNHQLAFILNEPNIQFPKKEQVVRDLLGGKVRHEALAFALLLVERGLVDLAPRVRDEFERMYNDYHNQVVAELTTAMPLDSETRAVVVQDLQHLTGKKILLREQVDPAILGGAIARVGDTLIDGSVRRRLTLLKQQLLRGGYFGGPEDGRANGAEPNGNAPTGSSGPTETAPLPAGQTPSGNGGARPPSGGPSSATSMAPRESGAHVEPRQPGQGQGQQPQQQRNQQPPRRGENDRRNRNNKGRRR